MAHRGKAKSGLIDSQRQCQVAFSSASVHKASFADFATSPFGHDRQPQQVIFIIDALAVLAKTLLIPPSGPLLISLLGIFWLRWQPSWGQWLLIGGILLNYGFSIPLTAHLLSRTLQTYPPVAESALHSPAVGAIVVLGGGLDEDAPEYGNGPTVHNRTLGRVRYAARLARLTGLPVLASGGRGRLETTETNPSEAELMKAILEGELGIQNVLTETASRDTWENAVNSAALLRQRDIHSLLLVSNAAHLPRAVAAFQAQGLVVIPAPTLFFNDQPDPLDVQSWLPSVTAIAEIHYAVYEGLGRLWYTARYHALSAAQDSR